MAKELGSNRKAEAELATRQRRAAKLNIRPLTTAQQTRYANDWTAVQEQFVDTPAEAVRGASRLVETVLRERGYPFQDQDEIISALSVHHTRRLGDYRHGREIRARSDSASTEELREAILSYRAIFGDLVGTGKAGTRPRTPSRESAPAAVTAADQPTAATTRVPQER
jgi:hypothetical protein